jgi:hypothetical protein
MKFENYRSKIRIEKDRELQEKKTRLKEELLNKYSKLGFLNNIRIFAEGIQNAEKST